MEERVEQLNQITKMCLDELQQAQKNCKRYASNIMIMTKELNLNWRAREKFLKEYDTFLTNITTILDAARKLNIELKIYDGKLTERRTLSKKKGRQLEKNGSGCIEASKSQYLPAEKCNLDNTEAFEDFAYSTLKLSEVYKPNDIITGTVTYIKSMQDLSFFILDYTSQYRSAIVELSKSLELRQYHGLPPTLEVFGCVLDNQIFRAVLISKSFYDDETKQEILPCYLLDTGEILPLRTDSVMYKLSNEQKQIPALALPCELVTTNKNPFKTQKENILRDIEYEKCSFQIIGIENNILKVDILDNVDKCYSKSVSENLPNTTKSNSNEKVQLTEEELEMLYDEALSTTNAMKAVMGYDPQDDKRICRFYDPSTGGCFKGVNCRLEHTLREPDGWTKDILPASSIIDNRHPITIFAPESIINITPTYIGELDRFYAQINEPNKNCQPLLWTDEDVPSWKLLRKPPHMYELVLCRYVDGYWYRAKIMSHDDEYKWFKVQYVDYGNEQMVHLRYMAAIDSDTAALPFQATLCRFQNVTKRTEISAEERKNCIEILCEMILNKTMDVKVISHYEDLFISFEDKKTYPLPELLVEMGILDPSESNILL